MFVLRPVEDWLLDASCAQTDPEIFFPDKGQSPREAKLVCAQCSVIDRCRAYADATEGGWQSVHGVFGGETAIERLRRRQAARRGKAA